MSVSEQMFSMNVQLVMNKQMGSTDLLVIYDGERMHLRGNHAA